MRTRLMLASKFLFAVGLVFGLIVTSSLPAFSQAFSVYHSFAGSDGAYPLNGLLGSGKILYGTTSSGGASYNGTAFKISATGVETVLHSFAGGTDGAMPQGMLIRDKAGNLYGTTTAGGAAGLGTVFKILGKKETVLYSFAGGQDGATPQAGLAPDAAGNLYGTTVAGGTHGNGTVFRLAPPAIQGGSWTETVLYSFGASPDGAAPVAGVTVDTAGNLYGTTSANGAYGYGTVFQLTPGTGWTETTLHSFKNGSDGSVPYAGLISDKSGNLYGAATQGGTAGGGTIFELSSSNGAWTFNVIYSVPGSGISGSFRDLMIDASGVIYGTTHCDGNHSAGTVYKLTPSNGAWTYQLLYTFTGGADGLYSFSNLVLVQGNLYGTTANGDAHSLGGVFRITP